MSTSSLTSTPRTPSTGPCSCRTAAGPWVRLPYTLCYFLTVSFADLCLRIALWYREGNFVKFYRAVSSLPPLLLLAVTRHCKLLLARVAEVCKRAYRSPNVRYPSQHLASQVWVPQRRLETFLIKSGVEVDNGFVRFGVINKNVDGDVSKEVNACYDNYVCDNLIDHIDLLDKLILGNIQSF